VTVPVGAPAPGGAGDTTVTKTTDWPHLLPIFGEDVRFVVVSALFTTCVSDPPAARKEIAVAAIGRGDDVVSDWQCRGGECCLAAADRGGAKRLAGALIGEGYGSPRDHRPEGLLATLDMKVTGWPNTLGLAFDPISAAAPFLSTVNEIDAELPLKVASPL
jgi:hypothetical protein